MTKTFICLAIFEEKLSHGTEMAIKKKKERKVKTKHHLEL